MNKRYKPKKNPKPEAKTQNDQNSLYRGDNKQTAPPSSKETLLSRNGSTFKLARTPASNRPQIFNPPVKNTKLSQTFYHTLC